MDELTSNAFPLLSQAKESSYYCVFNHYYPRLFRYVVKLTGNKQEAEDIVLKSFQKLFERYPYIKTDETIRAFLFVVARNDCLNYRNTLRVHRKMYLYFSNTAGRAKTLYPLEKRDERIGPVKAAISKLPPVCQKILVMIFFEEMNATDIAAQLNLAISTVHNHKNRGILLLQKQLRVNKM